jgi:hypothetical protein
VLTGFWWEDVGLYRRIILKWIFKMWDVKALTGFIWLKNRDRRQALVNEIMNLWVT